jgi:ribose 5-phosphate isomerase A
MLADSKAKKKASYQAIDEQVSKTTRVIGIGSGSTVVYAVERLAELVAQEKVDIIACVPSSFQAQQLILQHKLPLGQLNQYPVIDVCFDGADDVDSMLNCVKGGGACQLQEKLLISNAKKWFIVADYRKESCVLCDGVWRKGVPVEVIPSAYVAVSKKIEVIGGKSTLRMAVNKAGPVVTDNGMVFSVFIL